MTVSISDTVFLTIDRQTATPTRPALNVPLIAGRHSVFPERARLYTALADMVTDGFVSTSPEYLAVAEIKKQDPSIEKWKIGRLADSYTDSCTLQVTDTATAVGEKFDFYVDGTNIPYTTTSTSKTTTAAVLAGLIDAVSGPAATSSGDTITITRTGGAGFTRVKGWQRRLLKYKNTSTVVTTVGAQLDAILLEDSAWYGLIPAQRSKDDITQFADWAETNEKLCIYDTSDDRNVDSTDTGAVHRVLKTEAYDQAAGIQNANDTHGFSCAAWLGHVFAKFRPGQATWKFKKLSGISTDNLNGSEVSALEAGNLSYYAEVAGLPLTLGDAKVASGEYIDIIYGLAWLKSEMQIAVFQLLASMPKLPFTEAGMDMLRNAMLGVLKRASAKGVDLLVPGSERVEIPAVADVDPTTKGERIADHLKFFGQLQGAVHKTKLEGTVVL